MKKIDVGIIYKITYPNGKIYIGQDRTDDVNYFGSIHKPLLQKDFPSHSCKKLTVTKEILLRLENTNIKQLNKKEKEFILKYKSNDPVIGYNRTYRRLRNESNKCK